MTYDARVRRPPSKLDAYFSPGVTADELVALEEEGAVRAAVTLRYGEAVPGGLFDPDIFGPLVGGSTSTLPA